MWDWVVWGALAVAVVAGAAAFGMLVARALEAWRAFRRVRRSVLGQLDTVALRGQEAAERAERAADTTEVARAVAGLRRSLAQLAVLRQAVDDVQDAGPRILWSLVRR